MTIAIDREHEFPQSPDVVWAALTDWPNAAAWMADVEDMRASGPTEVGTVLTWKGPRGDASSTVVESVPASRLVLRSQQMGVTAEYRYELAPSAAGTRARLVADVVVKGAMRPFAAALRKAMEKADGGQLEALAATLRS